MGRAIRAVAILEAHDVSVWFRPGKTAVFALKDIDLVIREGDFTCLVGPSGCGKSTLLHLIAGFLRPSVGEILLDGRRIEGPGADRAVVMQHPTLLPWMTVYGNVELGPKVRSVPASDRRRLVEQYIDLVGLAGFASRRPYELSGGMQQRVAVARALANDSRLLLMDEPFGALDALTRETMQFELLRIWSLTKKTILFVTHDVEEAVACGTRVVVMTPGPGRIAVDRAIDFSRSVIAGAGGMRDLRAVKSTPAFVSVREELMATVLGFANRNGARCEPQ